MRRVRHTHLHPEERPANDARTYAATADVPYRLCFVCRGFPHQRKPGAFSFINTSHAHHHHHHQQPSKPMQETTKRGNGPAPCCRHSILNGFQFQSRTDAGTIAVCSRTASNTFSPRARDRLVGFPFHSFADERRRRRRLLGDTRKQVDLSAWQ